MSTLAELQSRAAATTQEISRLREREREQQRAIVLITNELNVNRSRATNSNLSASARTAAQRQVTVLEAELAQAEIALRTTQTEINQLTQQQSALDQQIALAQASPATLGPAGAAGVNPASINSTPANQTTNSTGTVTSTGTTRESLQAQLAQEEARRADFVRALNATEAELDTLNRRLLVLNATTGLLDFSARRERDEVARKIRELNAQQESIRTQTLPEIDRNIVRLRQQIAQTPVSRVEVVEDVLPFDLSAAQAAASRAVVAEEAANRDAVAQAQIAVQRAQFRQNNDWRVRLRLAGSANYLYRAANPGILTPLRSTDGVVFPYMPQITTNYVANYSNYELTHSNYRGYFYQNSHVSEINIDATFTAQDTNEANYLLAVIHFFRSVNKMFYGQDVAGLRGAPPPLVFLQGLGEFQFNLAPCVVQNFNYVLPPDVDYIAARVANVADTNLLDRRSFNWEEEFYAAQQSRLSNSNIPPGGIRPKPAPATLGITTPTYVPTQMQIALTLLPVQTRAQVSREFSLEQFANGSLIQRGFW
jgi:predicted nuclease with TOPRIM domain